MADKHFGQIRLVFVLIMFPSPASEEFAGEGYEEREVK
jgi:hypothetical protein